MALIRCNECGTEYSDRAAVCPKCACPTIRQNLPDDTKSEATRSTYSGSSAVFSASEQPYKKPTKLIAIIAVCVSIFIGVALVVFSSYRSVEDDGSDDGSDITFQQYYERHCAELDSNGVFAATEYLSKHEIGDDKMSVHPHNAQEFIFIFEQGKR